MTGPLPLRLTATAVGALLAWSASGCSRTIDPTSAEAAITAKLRETPAGQAPFSVHCPRDIPARAGQQFECTVRTDAPRTVLVAVVKQVDDRGTLEVTVEDR